MSVFTPINVAAGQDQKRALLSKLMDQYSANASRAAQLSGAGMAAGSPPTGATAVGGGLSRGQGLLGTGLLTGLLPSLAPTLIKALGPGGVGNPIAGRESSAAPGLAIAPGLISNPRAGGGVLSAGGAVQAPIPAFLPPQAQGNPGLGAPAVTPDGTLPASASINAAPSASSPAAAQSNPYASGPSPSGLGPGSVGSGVTPSGAVSLGNGLIYHPSLGVRMI
jgi:hypothetical protein